MTEDSLLSVFRHPSPVCCERSMHMAKKKNQKQSMSRSQKIMAIIGVLIILAMILPGLLSILK